MNMILPTTGTRAQQLAAVQQAADAAGVTIPRRIRDTFDAHRALVVRANVLIEGNTQAFASTVVDALADDRDPLADEQAARHTLHASIAARATDIRSEIQRREKALIRAHRSALADAARKPVEAAFAQLVDAATRAGNLGPRSTAEQVVKAGHAASGAWHEARAAQAQINAWRALARQLDYKVSGDAETFLVTRPYIIGRDAARSEWDAVLDGATLEWHHPAQLGQVVQTYHELRAEQAEQRRSQAVAAQQRHSKPIADAWAKVAARGA